MEDDKLNVLEAGALLGVSRFTVRALVRRRAVPFFKVGRRVVFSRTDLEHFLSECRVQPRKEVQL